MSSFSSSCFCVSGSGGLPLVEQFVRNKAVARQFHTWFEWGALNANQFFGLFGTDFKTEMSKQVKASEGMQESIRAFLEVGNERNKLVHQDFATFSMEKTLEEIYSLYKKALTFVEALPLSLRACNRPKAGSLPTKEPREESSNG